MFVHVEIFVSLGLFKSWWYNHTQRYSLAHTFWPTSTLSLKDMTSQSDKWIMNLNRDRNKHRTVEMCWKVTSSWTPCVTVVEQHMTFGLENPTTLGDKIKSLGSKEQLSTLKMKFNLTITANNDKKSPGVLAYYKHSTGDMKLKSEIYRATD